MNLLFIFPILGIVGILWFWIGGARHAVHMVGGRRAELIALGLTSVTVLAGCLAIALDGSEAYRGVGWLSWGVLFVVWFTLIVTFYPTYGPLIRIAGGGDSRKALLGVLYHLGGAIGHLAVGDQDPKWSKQARVELSWVESLETPTTARLAGLWRAEAAAVQAGAGDPGRIERHEAIRAEAQRLWPDGMWQAAAIFPSEADYQAAAPPR